MEKDVFMLEEYEINRHTMAILPHVVDGKIYSKVLEIEGELYVALSPLIIVEHSCSYYGSSFEGRKQGTKMISGITHKPPIAIDPTSDVYFFPTTSPKRPECIWLSLHHAYHHTDTSILDTLVTFPNKTQVEFPISKTSFETQLFRTSLLRSKLQQRVNTKGLVSDYHNFIATPSEVAYRSKNS